MIERFKKKKNIILFGSLIGGGISAIMFFLMDVLYADFQQGSWRDAIANDINRLMSAPVAPDSLSVYVIYVLVFIGLVAFGACLGIFFLWFLDWFFNLMKNM